MTIYLTTTMNDKDIVKAAGAKFDWDEKRWFIEDHQKSNPVFSKYLPIDNKTISDLEPKPDLIDETESQIFDQNSRIPNPFNHIKTYPAPEPKDEIAPATSSPEILESVIEEIDPATSVSEQPTKRTRGQFVKQDNDQNKRSYVLNNESINELDRLAKYFKLNLSDTIQKLIKIGGQWIEENGKDAEIKMINNKNEQLLEVIEKFASLQNQFQASEEKHNKEIAALKDALAKNSVGQIQQSTPINFEKIDERVDKKMNEALKKMDANMKALRDFTDARIDKLDDRTGPMQVYFDKKGGMQSCVNEYAEIKKEAKLRVAKLQDALKEGGK